MSIIGSLPVNLQNGTIADATQVMSDLSYIVSQVNANAAALTGGNNFTGAQTIAGDTIATLLASQSLSNKTLVSPAFSGTATGDPHINGSFSVIGAIAPSIANNAFFAGAAQWALILASGGADQKYYDCVLSGASIVFRFVNDAFNVTNTWLQATRSGTAVTFVTIANSVVVTGDGRLYGVALHNNANPVTGTTNQYVASGTYTPTLTNAANITSSSNASLPSQWTRVGNVVTVTGAVNITPTLSSGPGVATELRLSLPIPSTFTAASHAAGTANGAQGGTNAPGATISANLAAPTIASLQFFCTATNTHGYFYSFTYVVL